MLDTAGPDWAVPRSSWCRPLHTPVSHRNRREEGYLSTSLTFYLVKFWLEHLLFGQIDICSPVLSTLLIPVPVDNNIIFKAPWTTSRKVCFLSGFYAVLYGVGLSLRRFPHLKVINLVLRFIYGCKNNCLATCEFQLETYSIERFNMRWEQKAIELFYRSIQVWN